MSTISLCDVTFGFYLQISYMTICFDDFSIPLCQGGLSQCMTQTEYNLSMKCFEISKCYIDINTWNILRVVLGYYI